MIMINKNNNGKIKVRNNDLALNNYITLLITHVYVIF